MAGPQPVAGRVFEEIVDGYVPLAASLRALMEREAFGAMWVSLVQAPMMDLPDVGPEDPVPVRLDDRRAGVIGRLVAVAVRGPRGASVGGFAAWTWLGQGPAAAERRLPDGVRLAEPAFVRGIGLVAGVVPGRGFGGLRAAPGSPVSLVPGAALGDAAAPGARAWGLPGATPGLRPWADLPRGTALGAPPAAVDAPDAGAGYLCVRPPDRRTARALDALADDLRGGPGPTRPR